MNNPHHQIDFLSYLRDLNSTTNCCRSASLLLPITANLHQRGEKYDPNEILHKLRQWQWLCEHVLIQPWERKPSGKNNDETSDKFGPWYYKCLPSKEEILFLAEKYSSPKLDEQLDLRTELIKRHLNGKSLLVPLSDTATAFILRVLFEVPLLPESCEKGGNGILNGDGVEDEKIAGTPNILSDPDHYEKARAVQEWVQHAGITLVHNCDGNQTISLSKEVDCFPSLDASGENNQFDGGNFTFVDIFAGVGGFRIGMEALGGKCVGSCEIDAFARETYSRNFLRQHTSTQQSMKNEIATKEFFVNDITRLEIPPGFVDCLCGGFPCQSFSTLASHSSTKHYHTTEDQLYQDKGDRNEITTHEKMQGGLHTPKKGMLFFHLLRILRRAQPKMFLFENVKGLLHLDNGSHLSKILELLRESGYHVSHGVVDASWFLPQRRERVFFVGVRLDLMGDEFIHDLFNPAEVKRKYQIYANEIWDAPNSDKFDRMLTNSGLGGSTNEGDLPKELCLHPSRLGDFLESDEVIAANHSHCYLTQHQWEKVSGQSYLQLHSDGSSQLVTKDDSCAQTLVSSYRQSYLMHSQFVVPCDSIYLIRQRKRLLTEAAKEKNIEIDTMQKLINNLEKTGRLESDVLPRFLSPRECCRLQGFPENFVLPFDDANDSKQKRKYISQFYRQIGNAVSPPCVIAVAENAVAKYLLQGRGLPSICVGYGNESPVFKQVMDASPCPQKILDAISKKNRTVFTV